MWLQITEGKMVDAAKKSAVALVAQALREAKDVPEGDKRAFVEHFIYKIAAGSDGVQGTADDVLPKETVDTLLLMLQHGVVGDIAETFGLKPDGSASPAKKFCCFG